MLTPPPGVVWRRRLLLLLLLFPRSCFCRSVVVAVQVRDLCEQGLLTHHTQEDILEVIRKRHAIMHTYRLKFA